MSVSTNTSSVRLLAFDVFGAVVDWRSSVSAEGEQLGKTKGPRIEWTAFADAWRAIYHLPVELFELEPEQVPMIAAHEHDLQSARKRGLRTAFVHRPLEHGAG
jgi:hypothetical protein